MSADVVGLALALLGLIVLLGKLIRVRSKIAQKLFLPASILGGFLALLLGPYVFGNLASLAGTDRFAEGGLFGTQILEVWGTLPGLLISVVFAALFMGESIPSPKRAARLLGPQLSLGVTFASGQYVFGLALAVLVLVPIFGMTPMAGALIEMGFEGGHGTAAGMAPVMNDLGFTEGPDLALGMATIGIVSGIVIGIAAINWAVRTGRTEVISASTKLPDDELKGLYSKDDQPSAGQLTVRSSSVESMTLHVAFIALAILVGQLMLSALQWIESVTWADSVQIFEYVPLFPLAMLGGVIIQLILDKTGKLHLIDRGSMMRIQGLALDLLIVSALASLSLKAIAANIGPFLLLAGVGIVWNIVVLFFLARRYIPKYWFERGIGDFGQSMGVTATGLILMRIADPEGKSPAYEAFGYKQLVFEPFFGGGLITAAALPLIYQFGPYPLLIGMGVLLIASVSIGLINGKRMRRASVAETSPAQV